MEKTLALDLGSNSIGSTIRNTTDRENQFEKTTVITFETGVGKDDRGKYTESHAALRTSKRSVRRLYQSRKYKLWTTLEILMNKQFCPIDGQSLIRWKRYNKEEATKGHGGRAYPVEDVAFANWVKLDFNGDGKPDYVSPYELRAELVTKSLDFNIEENRHKLGRALYHIAQHRGFKSSKKVQNKEDKEEKIENEPENLETNIGAESKKQKKFQDAIEALKLGIDLQKQVGEIFSIIEKNNEQNNTNIRIRKELHQYVTRKMLKQEVDTIFKVQKIDFKSIFGDKTIMQSAIFWQRPLRSQKGTIGKCTLEPNKYRCPVSQPSFEEFRAWSFLNNIEYKIKDDKNSKWGQISMAYREELYQEKFFRISVKDFYFSEIAEWIKKKNQHDKWELNYPYKTNVSACPVSAKLKDIFGENWQSFKLETNKTKTVRKKDGTIKEHETSYNIDAIWHLLFDSDDEDEIESFAIEKLKLEKKTRKFVSLFKSMPVAYGMLSLKAINNILPFLRAGYIYTEATLLAKVPKILGDDIWTSNKAKILQVFKNEVIDKNRDEKRILNIANNLIAQYKALQPRDKFAERNYDYVLGERDSKIGKGSETTDANQILLAIKESFGEYSWKNKTSSEQNEIIANVTTEYQSFFSDKERDFKKLPHLQKSMKQFLADNFVDILFCPNTFKKLKDNEEKCTCAKCRNLDSLYHPSQIDIYPPAKSNKDGKILLGSPVTGAFKNPMALRALHELRRHVNYLITTDQIDEQTRIVVELAREHKLDDNNRRWAWDAYQTRRREENKEFRDAIYELIKDPEASGSIVNADSNSDIDKFRIWYEMIGSDDATEGFEKDKKFILLEKSSKIKKNIKGLEEETEEFNNDDYLRINKTLYFKLQKAKDNIQAKYKLWKEQECQCIYTGKMIRITDLFQENLIDFEHTIPRSKSFDNSLANLTVCFADYNRNIKQNQIPFQLSNYNEYANGYDAIKPRLEKWQQKVNDLKLHVDFWKTKSKHATTKEDKDAAIRQRHLWQFELNYWHDKVSRFTMDEIKSGFKKSQLIDTQIISKYAMHYLKTVFNSVEVQKGAVTAEFRKIFGIQETGTPKDRSMHSHHAKDAIVISLIPTPVVREQMLKSWFEITEQKNLLKSDMVTDKSRIFDYISEMEDKLQQLKHQCNLPDINAIFERVDEQILINNVSKDQTLTLSKKRIRSRGKVVALKDNNKKIVYQTDINGKPIQRKDRNENLVFKNDENGNLKLDNNGDQIPIYLPKEKWARGSSIRGQLHKESFLGAIKLIKKDSNGLFIKNENGEFEFEDVKHVIREDLVYKKNDQSPGFKSLKELEDCIVDKHLYQIIKKQVDNIGDFKEAINQGIWMLDKNGNKVNKMRHVRRFINPKGESQIKKHSHLSKHIHKQYVIAENAETPYYGLYFNDLGNFQHECLTLLNIAKIKNEIAVDKLEDFFPKKEGYKITVLRKQQKLFLLKQHDENYKSLSGDEQRNRLYSITKFYKKEGYIQMKFHLDARDNNTLKKDFLEDDIDEKGKKYGKRGINGFSEPNFEKPYHKLLLSKKNFNFLIEGDHFEINPDGKIKWL